MRWGAEGGQGKGSEGVNGLKRVTEGSGQEGVNFSRAGLELGGKWYWEEEAPLDPLFLPLSFLKLWEQYLWEEGRGGQGGARKGAGTLGVRKNTPLRLATPSPSTRAPPPARKMLCQPPLTLRSHCLMGVWAGACGSGREQPAANPRGQCPFAHWPQGHPGQPSPPQASCSSAPRSDLVLVGESEVPVYAHARCWLEEEEGQEAMSREGGTWPFPFPSSQISSLSGRSLFLAPLQAFPFPDREPESEER